MKLLCTVLYYICLFKFFKLQSIEATLINNKNELVDRAVTIIEQCFNDKSKGLVISTDTTNPNDHHQLLKILHSSVRPLSLVSFHPTNVQIPLKPEHTIAYPATNFVLSLFSGMREYELLQRIRESVWWNHEGTFLVIVRGCWRAASILRMLWTFNVLSGVLLCSDESDERMKLYVSNPFSKHAPDFWNMVQSTVDEGNGHPWTVFEHALLDQDYLQASRICENLNFLKTTKLHGYPVRIGVTLNAISHLKSEGNTNLDNIGGEFGDVARTLWTHLNATTSLQFYADFRYGDQAKSHGIFEDLNENRIDYGMNMMFLRDIWKRQTYPFDVSGICAVARKEMITAIQKFLIVFNSSSWFAIAGLCLVALLILKFLVAKKSWLVCSLEVARMTVGMSSLSRPRSNRKFFAIFLLITMFANFFLQYLVNSFYMLPNFDAVIDTLDDLVASNLPVYGYSNYKEFFAAYGDLAHRYRDNENIHDCLARLHRHEEVVCLYMCKLHNVTNNKLIRVAKNRMRDLYITFMIREDWPLLSRVNEVLARMREAGLFRLFRNRDVHRYQKYARKRKKWKSMNLRTATPIFLGLSWSIVLATCVFLVESVVYRGPSIVIRFFSRST